METVVKTLQYRSREEKKEEKKALLGKRLQNRLKLITALLAVVALAVSSVGLATVGLAADDDGLFAFAAEEQAAMTAETMTAETMTAETETAETVTAEEADLRLDRFTLDRIAELAEQHEDFVREEEIRAAEAARGSAIETDNNLEEDMVIMLLSECDSEAIAAAKAANEHIERMAAAAAEVPAGLTFTYNPDMCLDLNKSEIEVLERIVEAEATDEDVYGRMLVANVVINRVHSKHFANTVEKVVFQKIGGDAQFAPVSDGRYYSVKVTDLTREAVGRVLDGEDYSCGALYFFQRNMTTRKRASWFDKHTAFQFKYGCHEFFKEY